jgi:hypothetical protein
VENQLGETRGYLQKVHDRLLLGSVAFNYMEAAAQFVLGEGQHQMQSLSAIERAAREGQREQRWDEFARLYYAKGHDRVVSRLKSRRLKTAHPSSKSPYDLDDSSDEEDSDTISPRDLESAVDRSFYSDAEFAAKVKLLIQHLDALSRVLHRPRILRDMRRKHTDSDDGDSDEECDKEKDPTGEDTQT